MEKILFNNSGAGRWLLGLTGLALVVCHAQGQDYDPDWTRNFRVGPFVGLNIKANFRMNGQFNISGHQPGVYDDGYVRVDQTGNARGYTSFWGYTDAGSQYSVDNHTLTMHSATSFSASSGATDKGDAPYIGLDMAYGGTLWHQNSIRAGWEVGFGYLPIKITDSQTMSATINRSAFSFDTGGIVIPSGSYNGGSSGIGPLIHDTPTQLPGDTLQGTVSGSRTLDVNLYTVRLGPTIFWDVTPYIGLSASVGGAVGIVSGNLKFDETITPNGGGSTHNVGQISATDITYGGYINAMVTYHAVKNGDFFLGVQYMPLGNANISGGGRQAQLKLGGQIGISAGINWPF